MHVSPRSGSGRVLLRAAIWPTTIGLLGAVGGFANGQSQPSGARPNATALPEPHEILKKAIQRAKWSEDQKFEGKYKWRRHQITEQYDAKGKLKKREDKTYQVFPIDGVPYSRLVQKDGQLPTEKEVRQEQENERKFREAQVKRRRQSARGKQDDGDVKFNDELVGRYQWQATGREVVNGRPAYLLSFQPRGGELPVKRTIDRLLNRVAGRLWIDEKDFEIARADLHLAENVSAWGGLLASVKKFVLRFEQSKVDQTA